MDGKTPDTNITKGPICHMNGEEFRVQVLVV